MSEPWFSTLQKAEAPRLKMTYGLDRIDVSNTIPAEVSSRAVSRGVDDGKQFVSLLHNFLCSAL